MNNRRLALITALVLPIAAFLFIGISYSQDEGGPGPQGQQGGVPQGLEQKAVADEEWEKMADTNGDGIVDGVEIRQWKNRNRGQETGADYGSQDSGQGYNKDKSDVDRPWEKKADVNQDGVVDEVEINQWRSRGQGQGGSQGYGDPTDVNRPWEKKADVNRDGTVDQTEIDQWRGRGQDRDNNPPGAKGGPGTNWENKPGPAGGPGAGPNRQGQGQ
ncbi:MAG: hypothetical protein WC569_03330, partial [Candidatus Omnitrophota bacterium]